MKVRSSTVGTIAAARGFTLLELLVTVAIISVLIAILGVSVTKVRNASRTVMCMNNLKTVSQEFTHFADDALHAFRGDSDKLSTKLFRLEDFQEKLYRVHEFWDGGTRSEVSLNLARHPLACPAVPGSLVKRKDLPCSSNAIVPLESVSTGFNMRLDRVSTLVKGWPLLQPTRLSTRILEHPEVPLAFGVDGGRAVEQGVLPYYAAPPAGDTGLYGTGRFWFPSPRHDGKFNAAYIGGHVLSTADPGNSPKSNWKYQPPLK